MTIFRSKRFRVFLALSLMGFLLLGGAGSDRLAAADEKHASVPPAFVKVTDQAGVRHRHHKPILDKKLDCIMPWMASVGASAAAADYDNDGDIDLYVTNSQRNKPNRLFKNSGDLTFTDVGVEAGVAGANDEVPVFSLSPAFQTDLDKGVVSQALLQEMAGHNVPMSDKATIEALEPGKRWRLAEVGQAFTIVKKENSLDVLQNRGTSMDAAWGDYNNDGHLDLYVVKTAPSRM
jgi:hypothetical protein